MVVVEAEDEVGGTVRSGLVWRRLPSPVAYVVSPDSSATVWSDVDATAAGLSTFAAGDGRAWSEVFATYLRVRPAVSDALFTVFPPVRAIMSFVRRTRLSGAAEMARLAVTPAHRPSRTSRAPAAAR